MKLLLPAALLVISFSFQSYKAADPHTPACDSIPELNSKVIEYVQARIGKKEGRGECWDLAAGALRSVEASWDGLYEFGQEVFYEKECIYPGDIIQFKNVKVSFEHNGGRYFSEMKQHTAVIYEVKGKGQYVIAEQNTASFGRKVGLTPLDLENITKGKIRIFRPVR